MGTRNLTCVFLDGEYKIAQYGLWDGYPSGQGATALEFLRGIVAAGTLGQFADRVRSTSAITADEYKALWVDCGANLDSDSVSWEVSKKFAARYPHLSRGAGADILSMVYDGAATKLQRQVEFSGDSLFCEWCYVVDLDRGTFEVFKGFNKAPLVLGDRFYGQQVDKSEYYPVRLVKSYRISSLPEVAAMVERCEDRTSGKWEAGNRTYKTLYGARMAAMRNGHAVGRA